MAKLSIVAGSTSKLLDVFIQDSSSTTGAGLTGLVFNSAGLTAYYYREGAATSTAITLATMTLGTWATGGFIVVDGTNMPGCYQIGIPNAAIASGAKSVIVLLKGATNMAPLVLEIELTAVDNQDGVHFGLTSLPNTAVTTNGSLITSGAGTDQLTVSGGVASADAKKINAVATTSVTTVNANVGTTQPVNFTGAGASALVKGDMQDIAGAAVSTTTAQIGANVVQINGQTATAAAGVTFPTSVASPTNITAGTITTVTNLTNAPTAGDFTATMKTSLNAATPASVTGAVGSVTGNVGGNVAGSVGSVTAAVTVGTNNDKTGYSLAAGQLFIKKNTQVTITFPMTDSTTHAPKAGLGTTITCQRSIDGAAIGACANANAELSGGLYSLVLAAADVNGTMITLILSAAGADTRFIGLVTQP